MPTHRPAATAHSSSTNADYATSAPYCASETSRSLQLRRWLRKLAGRLVRAQKGVVLPRPWQGLPESGWWLRDCVGAIRLQRWVRQLDGWMVSGQESMVLLEQGQGLPSCCRWVCVMGVIKKCMHGDQWRWLERAIFRCCWSA